MIIKHNLASENANRYLNKNNNGLKKSLEKLSSGYKINRAGDNAAGLAVSEKMRAQIAGINQAVNNAQDGISMVQTFEGALTETHAILDRIKTLATQSANGTYSADTDRAAIELEYEQLISELNDISETDFNGIMVIDGAARAGTSTPPVSPVKTHEVDLSGLAGTDFSAQFTASIRALGGFPNTYSAEYTPPTSPVELSSGGAISFAYSMGATSTAVIFDVMQDGKSIGSGTFDFAGYTTGTDKEVKLVGIGGEDFGKIKINANAYPNISANWCFTDDPVISNAALDELENAISSLSDGDAVYEITYAAPNRNTKFYDADPFMHLDPDDNTPIGFYAYVSNSTTKSINMNFLTNLDRVSMTSANLDLSDLNAPGDTTTFGNINSTGLFTVKLVSGSVGNVKPTSTNVTTTADPFTSINLENRIDPHDAIAQTAITGMTATPTEIASGGGVSPFEAVMGSVIDFAGGAGAATPGGGSEDVDVYNAIYNMWFDAALDKIKATTGMELRKDITVNVLFDPSLSSSTVMACRARVAKGRTSDGFDILINPKFYTAATEITDENGVKSGGIYTDNVIGHELVHGLMDVLIDGGYFDSRPDPVDLPGWFKEGVAEAAIGNDRFGDFATGVTIGGLSPIDYAVRDINSLTMNSTGMVNYTAGSLFVHWLDNCNGVNPGGRPGGGSIKQLLGILSDPSNPNGETFDKACRAVFGFSIDNALVLFKSHANSAKSSDTFTDFLRNECGLTPRDGLPQEALMQNGLAEEDGIVETSFDLTPVSETETKSVNGHTVTFNFDMKSAKATLSTRSSVSGLTHIDSLALQIGARTKDLKNYDFNYQSVWRGNADYQKQSIGTLDANMNASAAGLGLVTDTVNLASQENANQAMDMIDNAINKVSLIRGTFGSIQNRLEHKVANLNNTAENLTGAESRIRDTDMAEEMMKFTKEQILAQSAQAMLSQANQIPQGILQLIQ